MQVPVIETERLRLRGHRLDDLADCGALWRDPVVTRYIGVRRSSDQDIWFRLLRYAGHWPIMGFGYWAVEEKSSGSFVGELGFADNKRSIEPSMQDAPELGWALVSSAHGKGYATEAVRAAVAWGDAHLSCPRTFCIIHPENVASLHVAAKCGYEEFQRATYNAEPAILFVRHALNG